MVLKEDIVDIEKPEGICSHNFVVDDILGLFLHHSIFSIINSRSAQMINGVLSDFLYLLNFIFFRRHYNVTKVFIFAYSFM